MGVILPIRQIRLYSGKVKTDLTFSYGRVDFFTVTIVEIDAGSHVGVGEAAGDVNVYRNACRQMIGLDAANLEGSLPSCLADKAHSEERECLSMALYDLVGKAYGIPCHVMLGGKRRQRVPLMPCIFAATAEQARDKAEKFANDGYCHFKLKLYGRPEEDAALVRATREALGYDAYLQADVNCGYKTYADASRALATFEDLKLTVIEDLLDGSVEEYRRLREQTAVKIMLDKDARSLAEVGLIVKNDAADVINQHPGQQGGLARALMFNASAAAGNVPTAVGGTGFLGVGTAAFQTLASVIGLGYPCGECGGAIDHGFEYTLVKNSYQVIDGDVLIPDLPGWGVELDQTKLRNWADEYHIFNEKGMRT